MFSKNLLSGLMAFSLLSACGDKDGTWETPGGTYGSGGEDTASSIDNDDDGFLSDEDCDDADSSINPGAVEICDGIDNNCDGNIDEDVTDTFYADADDDGFGDEDSTIEACELQDGYSPVAGDCDDTDAAFNPGATESCSDPNDYNCDGEVTYEDRDGDGVAECEDCDDRDEAIYPGAEEICDGEDNNCDGQVDENFDLIQTWYADTDADGYGDPDTTTEACEQPSGYIRDNNDCDDSDANTNPDAAEICDGEDNDCNGTADDDPTDTSIYYADADGDGHGDPDTTTDACSAPSGYVSTAEDCDDTDATISPNAAELCDEVDNNCDGTVDEATAADAATWYADADSDGYGDVGTSTAACDAPSGYVDDATDCDDADSAVNPGEAEICNDIDDDCDEDIDDLDSDLSDATTWYRDFDGDGYGYADYSIDSCDQPTSYVEDDTDCNDDEASAYPGAEEICDEIDNDCDGDTDEDDATDATTWYADTDGDGFGDVDDTLTQCDQPSAYVDDATDCDDTASAVNPAAEEECDEIDNDCDGETDEETAVNALSWYADADEDGFGNADDSTVSCTAPSGYIADDQDCDDSDAAQYPGADEYCNDEDDDCDGDIDEPESVDVTTWHLDNDGDGFGDPDIPEDSCEQPSGFVEDSEDCNDGDSAVNPDAAEVCDDQDNNCDGEIDENTAEDASTWYADDDADGYGDADDTAVACVEPLGYTGDDTDCDDSDFAINPGATEICDDHDNNCNGEIDEDASADALTWYADDDGDNYGDSDTPTQSCDQPSGYVSDDQDCNDGDAEINPEATEVCDEQDNDCDGESDEDDADDALTWYRDADGDTYGDADSTTAACEEPAGYSGDDTDCDDADAAINPAATEVCDRQDNNCDGDVDEATASDASTWYADSDSDGYGDASTSTPSCDAPTGYVGDDTDCDDTDNDVNPGEAEVCNDIDDDCDGLTDDDDSSVDLSTGTVWYDDDDADGYGDPDVSSQTCDAPSGYVSDDSDCDDGDGNINPAATEVCDDEDNNCDGDIDEDSASDATTWYGDNDGDGYGDTTFTLTRCDQPSNYVSNADDCDDLDSAVSPAATEVCNSIDDDCDGDIDDDDASVDLSTGTTYYPDDDGDGYGSGSNHCQSLLEAGNTTDGVYTIYPFGDGTSLDVYCNMTDEDGGWMLVFHHDAQGNAVFFSSDADAELKNEGDPEADLYSILGYLDYFDNDDGTFEFMIEWPSDATWTGRNIWTQTSNPTTDSIAGYSAVDVDYTSQYWGGLELSDRSETFIDGSVGHSNWFYSIGSQTSWSGGIPGPDSGAVDEVSLWVRVTDPGESGGGGEASCEQPSGYVDNNEDCDDTDSSISPDAAEVCDSVDNNCDGTVDDDATDLATWYADADADGYGDTTTTTESCDEPSGYVSDATDCDDADGNINPAATEVCNGADDDCDGLTDDDDGSLSTATATTWYADDDGDSYGDSGSTTQTCDLPAGYVADSTDCDDADSSINPAATEVCDEVDNDCDGDIDDDDAGLDSSTGSTFYADTDADGYGNASSTTQTCDEPSGYVSDATDCDDSDGNVNPAATEVCNSIDDDCDGSTDDDDASLDSSTGSTFYADADADGYGDSTTTTQTCDEPSGYTDDDTDCDDGNADINPAASEECDGLDNDCDGTADDGTLGATETCAAESCLEILNEGDSTGDGTYWLDPLGDGSADEYVCDMTTDGGGWTEIIYWNREDDGDTQADFESLWTENYNNMGKWEQNSTNIAWNDGNSNADAMDYEIAVDVPNGGESLMELDYFGHSMEDSAFFWYVTTDTGSEENILCRYFYRTHTSYYSSTELSYEPNYTCSTTISSDITVDTTYQDTFSSEIVSFHLSSFHYDNGTGDYSYLYNFGFWVR